MYNDVDVEALFAIYTELWTPNRQSQSSNCEEMLQSHNADQEGRWSWGTKDTELQIVSEDAESGERSWWTIDADQRR